MSRLTVVRAFRKLVLMWIENLLFQLFLVHTKGKRDRDQNVVHSFVEMTKKISRKSLDGKLTQQKLYDAEAEVEARNWEKRNPTSLFREFESQRFQTHQASQWVGRNRSSKTDKNLWIFYASRKESWDRESINDSGSGITEQSKFLVRYERIVRSWIREQLWSDPRSWSNFYDSEFPKYTELYGYHGKRFWTTTCSRRTIIHNLQQFKEFGIFHSEVETWYYRNSKERYEKGVVEYVNSFTSLPK